MTSKVLRFLSSIEKYSSLGENDKLVKGLCSLGAILGMEEYVPECLKTEIIMRLMDLLVHESNDVVRRTVSLLTVLTNDSPDLSSELILGIMQRLSCLLTRGEAIEHVALVSEMLSELTMANFNNVKLLHSSGCLDGILHIFRSIDLSKNSLENIYCLVNIIICAVSGSRDDKKIKILIGEAIIPEVLNCLNKWLMNNDPAPDMYMVLKDTLFLCRNVASGIKECQNIFLKNGGLDSLVSALKKTDEMQEHLEIVLPLRSCGLIDYSPTLFSSLVILMDVVVTHNNEACQRAMELDAIGVLRPYLHFELTSNEQKVFIIETIVHILEAEIEICSPSLIKELYETVQETRCSSQALSYLQRKRIKKNLSKRSATPHPNKNLSRGLCDKTNYYAMGQCAEVCSNQEILQVTSAIETGVKKGHKNKCTPHPKKSLPHNEQLDLSEKKEPDVELWSHLFPMESHKASSDTLAGTERSFKSYNTPHLNNVNLLKKPLKRLSSSKLKSKIFELSGNKKCTASIALQVGQPLEAKLLFCSTEPSKYIFSQAELLLLLQCVLVYGVNMHNIRRVFPFHKDLTPLDLYALWRAVWLKKPLRALA